MTTDDTRPLGRADFACLTPLVPDRSRAEAVRRRCRSALVRRAERTRHRDAVVDAWVRVLVPLALGTFSLFYAGALLSATLRFEAWLH
jgi:hypothetical protein